MWAVRNEVLYLLWIPGNCVAHIHTNNHKLNTNQEPQSRQLTDLDSEEHNLGDNISHFLGVGSYNLLITGRLLAIRFRMHGVTCAGLTVHLHVFDSDHCSRFYD